jgi:hypothetical protein
MLPGCLYLIGILAMLDHQGITSWYMGSLVEVSVGLVFALAVGSTIVLLLFADALRWTGGLLVGSGVTCLWVAHLDGDLTNQCFGLGGGVCASQLDWRIWVLVGLASIAVGVMLGFVAFLRSQTRSSTPTRS